MPVRRMGPGFVRVSCYLVLRRVLDTLGPADVQAFFDRWSQKMPRYDGRSRSRLLRCIPDSRSRPEQKQQSLIDFSVLCTVETDRSRRSLLMTNIARLA